MNDAPSQSQDKFIVRLPDGMRDRIKHAAERNNRSMNAEIVLALEYWLEADLPYTLPLGAGADRDDAIDQAREDRAEREEVTDLIYADAIDKAIQVLGQIRRALPKK